MRTNFPNLQLYSNRVQPVSIVDDKLFLHWQTDKEWEIVSDQIPCEVRSCAYVSQIIAKILLQISKQVLDNTEFVPYPPMIKLEVRHVFSSSEEMTPIEVTVLGIGEDRKFILNAKPQLSK